MTLDFAQTYADVIGYIGFLGALSGWLYQWKISQNAKKQELRSLWDNISVIKAVMGEIESAESRCRDKTEKNCEELPHEVYQAHAELSVLFRNTLARAITREDKVTLETIIRWRKAGKLASDWQQKCAMTILLTNELTDKELDAVNEKYSNWEEIDNNSSPLGSRNPFDKIKN